MSSIIKPEIEAAYREAVTADNAWQAELDRIYGPVHGSFNRYTSRGKGVEGQRLHTLYLDRAAKVDAWRALSGTLAGFQPIP